MRVKLISDHNSTINLMFINVEDKIVISDDKGVFLASLSIQDECGDDNKPNGGFYLVFDSGDNSLDKNIGWSPSRISLE